MPISCYCAQSIYQSTTASIVHKPASNKETKPTAWLTKSKPCSVWQQDSLIQWRSCVATSLEGRLNGLKLISSKANVNHKLDDLSGSMKTFGRAGKREPLTANGLQMFPTKKPFWILTTEIEVIFFKEKTTKKRSRAHRNISPWWIRSGV